MTLWFLWVRMKRWQTQILASRDEHRWSLDPTNLCFSNKCVYNANHHRWEVVWWKMHVGKIFLPKVGTHIFTFPPHIRAGCRTHYEGLKATIAKLPVQRASLFVDTIAMSHRRGNSAMGLFIKTEMKTILRQTLSPPFSCLTWVVKEAEADKHRYIVGHVDSEADSSLSHSKDL